MTRAELTPNYGRVRALLTGVAVLIQLASIASGCGRVGYDSLFTAGQPDGARADGGPAPRDAADGGHGSDATDDAARAALDASAVDAASDSFGEAWCRAGSCGCPEDCECVRGVCRISCAADCDVDCPAGFDCTVTCFPRASCRVLRDGEARSTSGRADDPKAVRLGPTSGSGSSVTDPFLPTCRGTCDCRTDCDDVGSALVATCDGCSADCPPGRTCGLQCQTAGSCELVCGESTCTGPTSTWLWCSSSDGCEPP